MISVQAEAFTSGAERRGQDCRCHLGQFNLTDNLLQAVIAQTSASALADLCAGVLHDGADAS